MYKSFEIVSPHNVLGTCLIPSFSICKSLVICLKNLILLVSRLHQEKIKTQCTVSKKNKRLQVKNSRKTSSLSTTMKIIATTSSTSKIQEIINFELCNDLKWYLISSMPLWYLVCKYETCYPFWYTPQS